jgi:GH25 family lysozyme M1 (1,4-beta-N-acetylmuramidase)
MIPGINISHLQKDIDWPTLKQAGFRFAFYAATHYPIGKSDLVIDPQLTANAAGTASHRIHAAPIHTFSAHVPGKVQAAAFIDTIRDLPFSLAPVVSLRANPPALFSARACCSRPFALRAQGRGGCPPDAEQLLAFLLRVELAFKSKPIIFTSARCWRALADVLPFVGYPLWLSQRGFTLPKPLFPFPMASFWQFSESGRVPGVIPPCGLDYFMGDEIGLLPFLCLNRYNDKKFPSGERMAV